MIEEQLSASQKEIRLKGGEKFRGHLSVGQPIPACAGKSRRSSVVDFPKQQLWECVSN